MVTHQLQVERRTGKVRRPETDVLPLCHATNLHLGSPGQRAIKRVCVCVTNTARLKFTRHTVITLMAVIPSATREVDSNQVEKYLCLQRTHGWIVRKQNVSIPTVPVLTPTIGWVVA